MNQLLNTKLKESTITIGLLLLRVVAGVLMMPHGYAKLAGYGDRKDSFLNFMGLSGPVSLALVVFAEFFCALLVATGLLTRFALIPLIVAMAVAVFRGHGGDVFGDAELPFLYLTIFITLFLAGPGKYSLDKIVLRK